MGRVLGAQLITIMRRSSTLLIEKMVEKDDGEDGDFRLDYESFLAMQPEMKARPTSEIRALFAAAAGGKECLTMAGYFKYSLSQAVQQVGNQGLMEAFKSRRDGH